MNFTNKFTNSVQLCTNMTSIQINTINCRGDNILTVTIGYNNDNIFNSQVFDDYGYNNDISNRLCAGGYLNMDYSRGCSPVTV